MIPPSCFHVVSTKIRFDYFPVTGYLIAITFCQLPAKVEDHNFIGNPKPHNTIYE